MRVFFYMIFKIHILGCGSALPTLQRNPTAQYINLQERHLLIDCGEGTQLQLRLNKIKFSKIDFVFISHLHGDHYLGLIGLLSSLHLLGRKKTLSIFGPKKLNEILQSHFEISGTFLSYKIDFHEINPNKTMLLFEDNIFKVTSIPLNHRIECTGFLIEEKEKLRSLKKDAIQKHKIPIEKFHQLKQGEDLVINARLIKNDLLTNPSPKPRSYAFCSDTKYEESIVPIIENVDLLYHEATFLENKRERAKKTFHSTAIDAAKIAKLSNAKKLLLGHYSARYNDLSEFEKEASSVFKNVIAVKDGDTFEIELINE